MADFGNNARVDLSLLMIFADCQECGRETIRAPQLTVGAEIRKPLY
jgi:hypothetical protein